MSDPPAPERTIMDYLPRQSQSGCFVCCIPLALLLGLAVAALVSLPLAALLLR
jgi:hypothetical protein